MTDDSATPVKVWNDGRPENPEHGHVESQISEAATSAPRLPAFKPPSPNGHSATLIMSLAKAACDASHCDNRQAYRYAKRTLDVLAAAPAVVLLAPLMLMIALAIRVDSPGAAIFRQERVGQYGRIFTLYKFRTMTSKDECPPGGNRLEYNRSRITRTGKFLRQTSLDELPQLFNVLRGDMSLVGPRPEIISVMLEKYEPWQYARLAVPPGITGWWQVTGRGTKPLHKHTQDDLYYIERASFWFDLKILLMTVRAVISRTGAY